MFYNTFYPLYSSLLRRLLHFFGVFPNKFHIFCSIFCYGFNFRFLDFPLNLTRNSNNQTVFWKFLAFRNQRICSYYWIFSYFSPVQYCRGSFLWAHCFRFCTREAQLRVPHLHHPPIWTPFSGFTWITALSWILVRLPIFILFLSPRSTALNHTLEKSSISISPITSAESAIKACLWNLRAFAFKIHYHDIPSVFPNTVFLIIRELIMSFFDFNSCHTRNFALHDLKSFIQAFITKTSLLILEFLGSYFYFLSIFSRYPAR